MKKTKWDDVDKLRNKYADEDWCNKTFPTKAAAYGWLEREIRKIAKKRARAAFYYAWPFTESRKSEWRKYQISVNQS